MSVHKKQEIKIYLEIGFSQGIQHAQQHIMEPGIVAIQIYYHIHNTSFLLSQRILPKRSSRLTAVNEELKVEYNPYGTVQVFYEKLKVIHSGAHHCI